MLPAPRGDHMRLAAAAALVLVFVTGLALGWGAAHHVREPGRAARPPFSGPPGAPAVARGALAELGLTPAQQARVDSLFAARRTQVDSFWRGPGQRLRVILDSANEDVRTVLDSGQRARYDTLRAVHQRREGRVGPRGGP
ncbi:MAG TPA: hypothetical protein VM536_06330, partial [Chloroflexia bacterium]|nr:hypothetical protein [Chloroflexia bacterium]